MRVPQSTKSSAPVLSVDSSFATLKSVDGNDTFVYDIRYATATVDALRANASTVKLSVRTSLPEPLPNVIGGPITLGDARQLIGGILTASSRMKDTLSGNTSGIIMTTTADLTANVSNESTRAIAGTAPASTILGNERVISLASARDLRKLGLEASVLQVQVKPNVTERDTLDVQGTSQRLLVESGIDPSSAGLRQSNIVGTYRSMSGIAQVLPRVSSSTQSQSRASMQTSDITSALMPSAGQQVIHAELHDDSLVPVMADIPVTRLSNTTELRVPLAAVGLNDFYVVFELMSFNGVVIESLTRRVPHDAMVRAYSTPKSPPRINIAPFQLPGKNVLELEQADTRAQRVIVYSRQIKRAVLSLDDGYTLVADIPLKKADGLVKFIDIVNNSSVIQYRCIAVGPAGIMGSEFANALSPAITSGDVARHRRSTVVTMNSRIVHGGIEVHVTSVPPGVVSVAVIRRDRSLFETAYAFLDVPQPIQRVTRREPNAVFGDLGVHDGHIYEYACRLFFDDGTVADSTADLIQRFQPLSVGTIEISIENVEVVRDNTTPDVRFNVTSRVTENNADILLTLLEKQGLSGQFLDELISNRERLQGLIAHSIERVDVTTGARENFGTFSGTNFSDSIVGRRNSVSGLLIGHKYRYVISTLLRDPETLFDDFEKTAVDTTTRKSYTFKPAFSRHPVTLGTGTLVTRESLVANHSEDDMSFGRVGNVKEVDVTLERALPSLVDVTVVRLDGGTTQLKWNVSGPVSSIEHFVIIKEMLGQSEVVGKAHAISSGKSFEFFDQLDPDDIGEISYRVVPVLNDYSRGPSISSNGLVVRDNRSIVNGV